MEQVVKTLEKINLTRNNGNNVNRSILINDTNDTSKKTKYSLDKSKFTPNTPETQLAEEIANYLNDTKNYACYLNVVNKIGRDGAYRLFMTVKDDVSSKSLTSTPVRKKAAYFM